jgi:hypothetical protein
MAPNLQQADPHQRRAGHHLGDGEAQQPVAQRTPVMLLDMAARLIHQPLVIDAGGTGGLAVETGETTVDVVDLLGGGRAAFFQHVLHQNNAAARTVTLIAQHDIGRAGRGAEAAMHA